MNAHIRDRRIDTVLLMLNERLHLSTIRSEHGAIPIWVSAHMAREIEELVADRLGQIARTAELAEPVAS